ncbi:MAG: peptidylprolyl isomerase [Bacteroidetes bacterium]|nr:MAG: peptidylprolyl isomerase [Bacteroidota bacterium]
MNSQKIFFSAVILALALSLGFSCQKSQMDKDREIIEQYISDNNLDAVEYDVSGMFYVIDKPGGTSHPNGSSDVTVNYDGHLIDGTRFDQADTINLNLGQVITGWRYGIPLIGEGGSIKLLIPSAMGYGTQKVGSIPENSVLIFDVDLILFN